MEMKCVFISEFVSDSIILPFITKNTPIMTISFRTPSTNDHSKSFEYFIFLFLKRSSTFLTQVILGNCFGDDSISNFYVGGQRENIIMLSATFA